ncbi:hypothetical protein J6S55_03020 [Candidatus Saccharibacteria bacterium]|nr:hypothetical protein [Candidatus Saccharibacteria bacterium]
MKNTINNIKQKLASYIYIYRSRFNSLNSYIKNSRNLRVVGISASAALAAFMTLAAFPITLKGNVAEASPGTANPSVTNITMTSTTNTASVNLLPTDSNGTFAYSSALEQAAFNVATNNVSGYTLNINGLDSTGQLTNTATGAAFSSIEYPTTTDAFSSTTSYNGKWGYLPSVYNSETNTAFRPAPTESGSTLNVTQCANGAPTTLCPNNQIVDNYTIGLGARADYTKPAGTYTNTFVLTAVGNPVVYSVAYSKGDITDTVANLPDRQYSDTGITDTNITLSSVVPTRVNYTFLYWCLGTLGNNGTTCAGTTYNPGASFGIDQTTTNDSTLYAVWSPNITIKTNTGIASVTLNGSSTTSTTGTTITGLVYGQTYNLAATLSTGYSFTSWNAGDYGTIADTSSTGATTTYTVGAGPSTITPTATINKYTCTKQYRLQNADGTWGSYTTDTTEQVNYGATCSYSKTVTNYKGSDSGANNSAASTSGTMTTSGLTLQVSMYRNTYSVSLTAGTGIASVSITGTGLKSGSGTASAVARYGGAITIAATLTSGYEWVNWTGSATYTSQSQNISSVTGNLSFTANGKSSLVNYCTQGGVSTANCMQTMTLSNCSGTKRDARDNMSYSVAKIGPFCWMTENLDLAGGTKLETTLSNVTSEYTLPASSTSGFSNDSTAYVYNSGRTNCSSPGCYSYYSYVAATAGTGASISSGNAPSDICPKGWRLPTEAEFNTLGSSYSTGSVLTGSPFLAVYGGLYLNSSFSNGGARGNYWSSTADGSSYAYSLYFDSSKADVNSYSKRRGFSVRCVKS